MRHELALDGIHVPLITPFTADGRIAGDALEGLARTALRQGAAGIVALGTTAETAALDAEERRTVVEVCARVCGEHGGNLIVGTGGGTTAAAGRAIGEVAGTAGMHAALVTVPSFVRPSQEGVLAHFRQLAADSPVPLVVYHVPYRTGRPLAAATLRALGRIPGVAGVKYAAGGIDQDTVDLLGDPPEDFAVLAGDDVYASAMLALGAPGAVLASAHLVTDRFAALADLWHTGDAVRARALGHRLARLSARLFAEPNPTVLKGVLHAQGRIPTSDVRLPLLPASRGAVDAALKELADIG